MNISNTSAAPRSSGWHNLGRWLRPIPFHLSMVGLLLFLLFTFALPFMVREVPAGQVGVLWRRFRGGTDTTVVLNEGIQLILPWDKMVLYSARLRELQTTYDTLSSNGLAMKVDITVRYRINAERVGELHKHIGPDFERVLVRPSIGAVARKVISQFTPEQLYSENRIDFDSRIENELATAVQTSPVSATGLTDGDLINYTDILIRGIELPVSLAKAIERKAEQNQLMLEYQYRLSREELERKRREIEAQGLRAYETEMPNGISQSYLVLRGIEATAELAKSPNAKIVMFGSQTSDLPFVLNSMLNAPQTPQTVPGPAPGAAVEGLAPADSSGTVRPEAAAPRLPNRAGIATQMPRLLQRMNPLAVTPPAAAPPPATPPTTTAPPPTAAAVPPPAATPPPAVAPPPTAPPPAAAPPATAPPPAAAPPPSR